MNMKLLKTSALLLSALMFTGCASKGARQADAAALAANYAAGKEAQLIAESATLDRADAAMQTLTFTDSGGNPITMKIQGNYSEAVALNIPTPPSEVQAQMSLQRDIAISAIPAAVTLYEGRQNRNLERAKIKVSEGTRRLQIESSERIAINRDALIKDIALGSVAGGLIDEELTGYPCAIRPGVLESDFVSGSISDGIDEDGSSGLPCVDYEPDPVPVPVL